MKAAALAALVAALPAAVLAQSYELGRSGDLVVSERLRIFAQGRAFAAEASPWSRTLALKSDLIAQGFFHEGPAPDWILTEVTARPTLGWSPNLNGGVGQRRIDFAGGWLEVDPAYVAKAGPTVGIAVEGEARLALDGDPHRRAGFRDIGRIDLQPAAGEIDPPLAHAAVQVGRPAEGGPGGDLGQDPVRGRALMEEALRDQVGLERQGAAPGARLGGEGSPLGEDPQPLRDHQIAAAAELVALRQDRGRQGGYERGQRRSLHLSTLGWLPQKMPCEVRRLPVA